MVESNSGRGIPGTFHPATVTLRRITEMGRVFEKSLEHHLGVNPTDREAMEHLISRGPLTATQLAHAIDHSPAGTTSVIDRLERVGHITRQADPSDRRKTLIVASPTSQQQARDLLAALARSIDEAANALNDDEQAVVERYLADVAEKYRRVLDANDPG
jgi:DNA-binding MarR family transcriptional regulator